MNVTLDLDDSVMAQLEQEAVRQGRTMPDLVEAALRSYFHAQRQTVGLPSLPTFNSGGELVDISDRDALYRAMDGF